MIRESGKREARSRLLPAHVVVYYVLALKPVLRPGLRRGDASTSAPCALGG
ncbi:MAG: transposase domain-containing protein [Pseudonocardiaceae bacterium]